METKTVCLVLFLVVLAIQQNVVILNRGCKEFNANGDCLTCSQRYYKDGQGICQPVNVNCNGYNPINGACTSCYPGFVQIEDTCLPEALFSVVTFDPFCNQFEGDVCVKCAWGYFFDSQKRCRQSDPNCASFNQSNGNCLSCYVGFTLNGNRCVVAEIQPSAQNCNEFSNGVCVKCSIGFYFNNLKICTKIPDECRNFNIVARKCEGCYTGYELNKDNLCVKAVVGVTDLGCSKFENGQCIQCSVGYYFNSLRKCTQIPPTCANFDTVTETCQECFPGYALNAVGVCVAGQADSGCNKFENGICVKCSNGFYFGLDGNCKQIPSTCFNFDTVFEKCISCYPGYLVNSQGVCIESKINAGCKTYENSTCVACSFGFYFGVRANETRICKQIPTTCADFNTAKETCISCYPGYVLDSSKNCIRQTISDIDAGCSEFKDGLCVKCSFGFYFDNNGKCNAIPATCANFDIPKKKCLSCYQGYTLNSNMNCVKAQPASLDPGCNEFNNGICVKCSFGYYFDSNKKCVQIPVQCANFNVQTRKCLSCFTGYALENQKCVKVVTPAAIDDGCRSFEDGVCVECSQGYYFEEDGKCQIIPPSCKKFGVIHKSCLQCYEGYALNQDFECVQQKAGVVTDPGCNTFTDGVCTKCSFGYYFNQVKKCIQIPVSCARFDTTRRICLECYAGYTLNNNKVCIESETTISDPGCAEFKNNICVKCSFGYYFKDKKCLLIPPTCAQFNIQKQVCESCYPGYALDSKKRCIEKAPEVVDSGCTEFQNNLCVKCSEGYYFNDLRKCQIIPVTCQNFDIPNRICRACYPGYTLDTKNHCIQSSDIVIDPYCKSFKDGVCVQCAKGSFFNAEKKCQVIDPFCKTFDPANGACTSCYPGYEISGLTCIVSTKALGDPNCKTFVNNVCVECSFRHYQNSEGRCIEVNPNCQEYDSDGACTSCYVGFKIEGAICVQDDTIAGDPNCAEWADGLCMRCSTGTFFDPSGMCKSVDPLCKDFNQIDGACLSCYIGFRLEGKKCIQDQSNSGNAHCAEFSENEPSICLRCSKGYYFNAAKLCTKVSDLCATYNEKTGECLSCFIGYELIKGQCFEKATEISDLNCAKFDNSGKCMECSGGYYFNAARICIIANPLCRLFNAQNGRCTECYIGYALTNGACIRDEKNADLCAEYLDKICIRCAERAYYNEKGACQLVDDNCKTFDIFDGACTSCYPGFVFENGSCRKAAEGELGCAQYDDAGKCIRCPERSYLEGVKCIQVADTCKDFDYSRKACVGCYAGYALLSGKCEISEVEAGKQIENCFAYTSEGMCLQCFDRYYLKDDSCHEVDIFCKDYNKTNGACTDCYTTFKLQNGRCVQ